MILDRATPDELDRRACRERGWRRDLLRQLAAEARAKEPVEITTSYRRQQ